MASDRPVFKQVSPFCNRFTNQAWQRSVDTVHLIQFLRPQNLVQEMFKLVLDDKTRSAFFRLSLHCKCHHSAALMPIYRAVWLQPIQLPLVCQQNTCGCSRQRRFIARRRLRCKNDRNRNWLLVVVGEFWDQLWSRCVSSAPCLIVCWLTNRLAAINQVRHLEKIIAGLLLDF